MTRKETFDDLDRWIFDFKSVVGEDKAIAIVGNKVDLGDLRSVSTQEGKEYADKIEAPFVECSAKLGGDLIPQLYTDLVRRFISDQES